jgi:hypothetical protein
MFQPCNHHPLIDCLTQTAAISQLIEIVLVSTGGASPSRVSLKHNRSHDEGDRGPKLS